LPSPTSCLVTGAAGSIGSELCRQLLQSRPQRLLLLDHNEFGLYTLHHELHAWCHAQAPAVDLVPLLASVTSMTAPVASGWSPGRVGSKPTGKRRLFTAHTHKRRSPVSHHGQVSALMHSHRL
jgi:NAD(P)-dependent dehydrogenase (short-subunit alcohol dehydrogenase family)